MRTKQAQEAIRRRHRRVPGEDPATGCNSGCQITPPASSKGEESKVRTTRIHSQSCRRMRPRSRPGGGPCQGDAGVPGVMAQRAIEKHVRVCRGRPTLKNLSVLLSYRTRSSATGLRGYTLVPACGTCSPPCIAVCAIDSSHLTLHGAKHEARRPVITGLSQGKVI